MKRWMSTRLSFLAILAGLVSIVAGCKTEIVNPPNSNQSADPYHVIGWNVRDSSTFHGVFVQANGYFDCAQCHGITTYGGSSGISCLNCHNITILGCTGCHGGKDNNTGAPPYSIYHDSLATDLGVGAHTAHMAGKTFSDGIPCQSCHSVPIAIADKGHFGEDSIAEVTFSGISGASSSWTRSTATCAQTYCHGNFIGGDATAKQIWNAPGTIVCGSCHDDGTTPALLVWKHEFHIIEAGLQCADCHATVVDTGKQIVGKDLHINGQVEFAIRDSSLCASCHSGGGAGCTGCHGGVDNQTGAPPNGLRGETPTTQRAVGAHTSHVEGNTLTDGILCSDCHKYPTSFTAPGHLGSDSIAELTFSALAGGSSSWNRTTNTCTNTYCHGNFTGGKPSNAPVWTGSNQAACGSCHDVGADAASLGWKHDYHVNGVGLYCNECHASVVGAGPIIVGPTLHVNGVIDTMTRDTLVCNVCHKPGGMTCTACHGGIDNQTGAPPHGLRGETATTQRAVGAHSVHLSGNTMSNGFACTECHLVPTAVASPGHFDPDSIAEMTWGPLTGSATLWNRTTSRCTNSYCHGNFSGGKTANAPLWTGSGQAACGSCHDVGTNPSQLGGRHDRHVGEESIPCYRCHNATVNSSNAIIGKAVHINRQNTVQFSAGGTYSNGTCSSIGCHDAESW